MKQVLILAALLAGLLGGVETAAAQVTTADSAAVLMGMAHRLRAEGRVTLANSIINLVIERFAGTPAAVEAQQMRAQLRRTPDERSGRTELLVWNTAYGMSLGIIVPAAFHADGAEAYGVGLIVGGPVGYLTGRAILRDRSISEGQARAISFGTLWGAWQGAGWTGALDLGTREVCGIDVCFQGDQDGETILRGLLLGSLVGMGTGLYLSRKEIPAGTATTVNFGALWGTGYGLATSILFNLDDDNQALTAALIGGNVGLVATALLAPQWNLSRGRARLISITGVAGLLAGAGALMITQPDGFEGDEAILVPVATSAAGLALGAYWTRKYDERAQAEPDRDALLDLREGRWGLGMPEPGLRWIETREAGRPAYRPGVSIPLLKAAF